MSTEQKKSALVRLGYFGEASYTSIGEPYDNKRAGSSAPMARSDPRTQGRTPQALASTDNAQHACESCHRPAPLTRLHRRPERKAEEDGPAVFKLSTNPIKGKFSIMNGLFDPQGGVGTGVGSMYLHPQNAVAMRDMQSNLVPCLLACAPDLPVSSYAFDTLGTPSCPVLALSATHHLSGRLTNAKQVHDTSAGDSESGKG